MEDKITSTEDFIEKAAALHKGEYDYTKTVYDRSKKKCIITCKIHGDFDQTPASHMSGSGCPACAETNGERKIREFLEKHNIAFETQKTYEDLVWEYPLRYDFYVPSKNAVIEFHGIQHYESVKHFGGKDKFAERQERDRIKKEYAKDNNIIFLEISYKDNYTVKLRNFFGIELDKPPNLFERFTQLSGKDMPLPDDLSLEERCALTHSLRLAGESMIAIANYFGVTRQTVYNYYNKAKEERLMDLESKTYLDVFADRLFELESQRDLYRKTIERVRSGGENHDEIDPRTGEVTPKTSHLRNISELGKLVLAYDKLIIDLEYAVGMIPKNSPESLYGRLSDRDPSKQKKEKDVQDMNDEEISNLLVDKLMKKQTTLGETTLKNLQNERVL